MSIINLEKTIKNNTLVYCNLDNKIIIECICLDKLSKIYNVKYDEKFGCFVCDKVKIITIYDIYRNIIDKPIQTTIFNDPIKVGKILENLDMPYLYFFKTFIRSFIIYNKINNIEYYPYMDGFLDYILYDNIQFFIGFVKIFNIKNNEGKIIYRFYFKHNNEYFFHDYEKSIIYVISNNYIKIQKIHSLDCVYCNKKNLKIFKIMEYYEKNVIYIENRNNNNEITNFKKYNNNEEIINEFFINNTTPPFSKPLKKIYIKLIDHCNINNFIKIIKSLFKKEKYVHYNLLLNYNLEIMNFK